MGPDAADTLMGYLPPVGWADVVTRADVVALEARLDQRFAEVGTRFAEVGTRFAEFDTKLAQMETSFERALRHMAFAVVGAVFTSVGVAVGLAQVLG